MTTWNEFIQKRISEKNILIQAEASQRLLVWELHSGSIYKKSVDHFTLKITEEGVDATERDSIGAIVGDNEFFYSHTDKIVYYRGSNGDPINVFTVATYRIGFSDRPYNLPIDDNDSKIVHYMPLISREISFGYELETDNIGIALESESTIRFLNAFEKFWKLNYELLTWDSKRIRVFSTSPELSFSQKQVYFDGFIEDKSYSRNEVLFKVKDFQSVLREPIPLNLYDNTIDTGIPDSTNARAKRRVYGRVNDLKVQNLNLIKDGFETDGTWTGISGSKTLTGTFPDVSQLSPKDKVIIPLDNDLTFETSINTIDSSTQITLTEALTENVSAVTITIDPEIQSIKTGRNDEWLVSDHEISELSVTILVKLGNTRFQVDDITGFEVGNKIEFDTGSTTYRAEVKSISNDVIQTQTALPFVLAAHTVRRNPIQSVFIDKTEFIVDRDFTVTNSGTARIIMDNSSEINVAQPRVGTGSITLTNASQTITGSSSLFTTELTPRSLVKPDSVAFSTYIEVQELTDDTNGILRGTWPDANYTGPFLIIEPKFITDDSVMTVNCYGKTKSVTPYTGDKNDPLIENGPDIVLDLLNEVGLYDRVNLDSFTDASAIASYQMSLPVPFKFNGDTPKLRDVITKINDSIFGALYNNNNYEIAYSVIGADLTSSIIEDEISQHDIINYRIDSSSIDIIQNIDGRYRHGDSDRDTFESNFKVITESSEYVQRLMGSSKNIVQNFNVYKEQDAQILTERKLFFHELPRADIMIEGKLNLANLAVNSPVLIDFNNLYARLGSVNDTRKVGLVLKIQKSAKSVKLTISDLSNAFNRCCHITEDGAADYEDATSDERLKNGFMTSDTAGNLVDNDESTYLTNLIC